MLSEQAHIGSYHSFAPVGFLVFYFVSLIELQPVQCGYVDEDVLPGGVVGNEPVSFGFIEEFNCSSHEKKDKK